MPSVSACLVLLVGLAISPSAAQALPIKPSLAGTYPASPGTSTTPRIYGSVSVVSPSGVGLSRAAGWDATSSVEGEEGTITIYAEPGCTGPVAATGTGAQLANSGIPVTVTPGSTTTFSATNTDLTGTSQCSNSIGYRHVTDPPSEPIVTAVSPVSPADDNLPHVIGSADSGATVTVFTNASCSGPPAASGSAVEFAGGGVPVAVGDNTTTTFYARASWAELPSPCSTTSVSFQEVSVAPPSPSQPSPATPAAGKAEGPGLGAGRPVAPQVHTIPGGRANNTMPLVAGSAPGASGVDVFKNAACTGRPVASGSSDQFSAGFPVPVPDNATTRFYARASDAHGTISDCSDQQLYTEDSTPPQTRITLGPSAKTAKRVVVFRFADVSDDPPGTTFACRLDRRPWSPCQSPMRLRHLRPGAHLLRIKATDTAGNEEATGTFRRFKLVHARR